MATNAVEVYYKVSNRIFEVSQRISEALVAGLPSRQLGPAQEYHPDLFRTKVRVSKTVFGTSAIIHHYCAKMETESPPKSTSSTFSSSNAIVQPTSSKRPTYTTAGTIYKPSSSQPLQPPTRRGRSSKWPLGGLQSDLALLPKSVLAGLPLKAPLGRPVTALQHYTPLQQNYDRATSPFGDYDHVLAKMPPKTPSMRAGNTPGPSSLPSLDASQIKFVIDGQESNSEDESTEDDDSKDLNTDPLMSMTVKSLQNLASYPNPNQKKAQKALLRSSRSRPVNFGYPALNSVSSSPPSFSRFSPPAGPSDAGSRPNGFHRLVTADSAAGRRAHIDVLAKIDNSLGTQRSSAGSPRESLTLASGAVEASMTLLPNALSGNGTPLPLTAGPPGQRQYRPSTFESTFKALTSQSPSVDCDDRDEDSLLITSQTLLQAGIEDESLTVDSLVSLLYETTVQSQHPADPSADEQLVANDAMAMNSLGNISQTNAHQGMENFPLFSAGGWRDMSPKTRVQYKPGTDRLTDAALAARNEETDGHWYARVNMLRRVTRTTHLAESKTTYSERCAGVIGDKRPQKDPEQLHLLDIDTAVRIPTSEHMEPILEMALQSLSQIKDDSLTPWIRGRDLHSAVDPDNGRTNLQARDPKDTWTLASPVRARSFN